jgi:hypothetical protein
VVDRFVVGVVIFLVLAHLCFESATALGYAPHPIRLFAVFSLNAEQGVGTWAATLQLALAAAAAGVVGRHTPLGADRTWWFLLALVLLAASAEEVIGLHEHLSQILGTEAFRSTFRNAWILVGLPVVVVLALIFGAFIRRQPQALRRRLLAGAACFVLGAIGFELLSGLQLSREGRDLPYVIMVALEEGFELGGVGLVLGGVYRTMLDSLRGNVAVG